MRWPIRRALRAPRKAHLTTRQNFQLHHVPLPDAAKLIREISASGLSSREGCGNTIRNVTGDPWAGVCEGELFDPTPYVGALVRYFVRHEVCQVMPRKFKTRSSATDEDRAITGIHDAGFLPRIKDGKRGFEIRIGGGTSIMPRVAPTLYEFVGADDGEYLKVTGGRPAHLRPPGRPAREPCPRPDQGDDRPDRDRRVPRSGRGGAARRLGRRAPTTTWRRCCSSTTRRPRRRRRAQGFATPNGDAREFEAFAAGNMQAQRQAGFSTVEVKVPRGDLTPEQLRGLARDHARVQRRLRAHDDPAEPRAALGARRVAVRGLAGARASSASTASARGRRRHRQLPRHRQLQARASPARWGSTRALQERVDGDGDRATR